MDTYKWTFNQYFEQPLELVQEATIVLNAIASKQKQQRQRQKRKSKKSKRSRR